jgi:hypothetical protein
MLGKEAVKKIWLLHGLEGRFSGCLVKEVAGWIAWGKEMKPGFA